MIRFKLSLAGESPRRLPKRPTARAPRKPPIIGNLKTVGHIDLAVYTGQFTRDETAGVDLFLVGEVNPTALQKFIDELETKENKSIRYTVMSLPDFQYRQQIRDRFAVAIGQAKKQVIVDVHNLLED